MNKALILPGLPCLTNSEKGENGLSVAHRDTIILEYRFYQVVPLHAYQICLYKVMGDLFTIKRYLISLFLIQMMTYLL